VQVLDRASGRVLGHAQRRAMRAWARDAGARGRAEAA
jgi:hypothetical protein